MTTTHTPRGRQAGFSLIELLVAMAITLIVSGAIFGIMAAGQTSFKREPEISDRQQNIRVAMDLISRDVMSAGQGLIQVVQGSNGLGIGMPLWVQYLTQHLDGDSSGANRSPALDKDGGTPMGLNGHYADELEMLGNPDGLEPEPTCGTPGAGNSQQTSLTFASTKISVGQVVMIILTDGTWTIRTVTATHTTNTGQDYCESGGGKSNASHVQLDFSPGKDASGLDIASGICEDNDWGTVYGQPCMVQQISSGVVVHYRIRTDANGVPNLERFASDTISDFLAGGGTPTFQVVARGVEDMQIQYATLAAPDTDEYVDSAPIIGCPNHECASEVALDGAYGGLITKVIVTLSARTDPKVKLQGASVDANLGMAVRGSLTSSMSVRSALFLASQRTWGTPPPAGSSPTPTPSPHQWN